MADKNTRIAIVNHDKCKPKKCRQECKKSCPVVRMGEASFRERALAARMSADAITLEMSAGKLCIEVTPQSKIVFISESLCIGCGICIKVDEFRLCVPLLTPSRAGLLLTGPGPFCSRNVPSQLCQSSTCPATWRRKPHTDTVPIPSNCTGMLLQLSNLDWQVDFVHL